MAFLCERIEKTGPNVSTVIIKNVFRNQKVIRVNKACLRGEIQH